jgi:hypothetical protein
MHRLDLTRAALPMALDLAAHTGHAAALAVWGNFGPTIVRMIEASQPAACVDAGRHADLAAGHRHGSGVCRRRAARAHRGGDGQRDHFPSGWGSVAARQEREAAATVSARLGWRPAPRH